MVALHLYPVTLLDTSKQGTILRNYFLSLEALLNCIVGRDYIILLIACVHTLIQGGGGTMP